MACPRRTDSAWQNARVVDSDPQPRVIAQGEVPFALLDDGRVVQARYRTTATEQPRHSLSDPESTDWTLTLDGHAFAVTGRKPWLPIGDEWARGANAPLPARAEGRAYLVEYFYLYAHHLGWSSGPVTLTFDLDA